MPATVTGVDELIARVRAADRDVNDAIGSAGVGVLDRFAADAARTATGLGRIEGRNTGDYTVFRPAGSTGRIILRVAFGGHESFSGGATTAGIIRPYEFGSSRGVIEVRPRHRHVYYRSFPLAFGKDGRTIYPTFRRHARRLVSDVVGEVYRLYRVALGDVGWAAVYSGGVRRG